MLLLSESVPHYLIVANFTLFLPLILLMSWCPSIRPSLDQVWDLAPPQLDLASLWCIINSTSARDTSIPKFLLAVSIPWHLCLSFAPAALSQNHGMLGWELCIKPLLSAQITVETTD